MNKYYVYAYLREDGTPYYIGKGSGKRMYTRHGRRIHPPVDRNRIVVIEDNLTEEEAFVKEKSLILTTPNLHNLTDGGEGVSGYRHTEETKQKISDKQDEIWTPERREWKSQSMKGNSNRLGTSPYTWEEREERRKKKHRENMRRYRAEGKYRG